MFHSSAHSMDFKLISTPPAQLGTLQREKKRGKTPRKIRTHDNFKMRRVVYRVAATAIPGWC